MYYGIEQMSLVIVMSETVSWNYSALNKGGAYGKTLNNNLKKKKQQMNEQIKCFAVGYRTLYDPW